jgi:serine/threonine protein kinase
MDDGDIVFGVLFALYIVLLIISFLQLKKTFEFTPSLKNYFVFYISIIIVIFLRVCLYLSAIIIGSDLSQREALIVFYVPGLVYTLCYLLLVWLTLSIYPQAHIKPENQQILFKILGDIGSSTRNSRGNGYIVFFITVLIGMQSTLYLAFISNKLSTKTLSRENIILNLTVSTSILILLITIQIKFASLPSISDVWKSRTRRVTLITYIWTITKIIRDVINLAIESFTMSASSQAAASGGGNSISLLGYFMIQMVCEWIPLLMTLETKFIQIFMFSETADGGEILLVPVQRRSTVIRPGKRNLKFTMVAENPFKKPEDIKIIESYEIGLNKLGKTYKLLYNNNTCFYRKVTFPRLSPYIIEEFLEEIHSYKEILTENIIPVLGIIMNDATIGLISPYLPNHSLFIHLHQKKTIWSFKQKIEIAITISEAIEEIHSIPRAHGHLSSHNILLDESMQANISDLGFIKLKKYAGLLVDYTNVSAWSSPEIIEARRSTPQRPRTFDDVFSFGMILWEIMTQQIPFDGLKNEELFNVVVKDGFRPVLDSVPFPVANIIYKCWNPNPVNRPEFVDITEMLQELIV